MEEGESCEVEIWMFAPKQGMGRKRADFDTICEARSWLKESIPALVTLYEQKVITGFDTSLRVRHHNLLEDYRDANDETSENRETEGSM